MEVVMGIKKNLYRIGNDFTKGLRIGLNPRKPGIPWQPKGLRPSRKKLKKARLDFGEF